MSNRKTLNEQIESAKEKIRQEENRLKQYLQKEREQNQKARTHRLIGRGAILESMIDGAENFTNEQIQTLLKNIFATPYARQMLTVFYRENATSSMANETARED